jgi:hypothetical protein
VGIDTFRSHVSPEEGEGYQEIEGWLDAVLVGAFGYDKFWNINISNYWWIQSGN